MNLAVVLIVVCSDVNQMLSTGELHIAAGQTHCTVQAGCTVIIFYPDKSTVNICLFFLSVSAFAYLCAANTIENIM